ncbi:MAG: DUF1287 domain-containing protein [Planctomycetes bacterium]|nr:DUF1287 domain-containing protein [Planctomycetota bacterium]
MQEQTLFSLASRVRGIHSRAPDHRIHGPRSIHSRCRSTLVELRRKLPENQRTGGHCLSQIPELWYDGGTSALLCRPQIARLSDRRAPDGVPLVIHNIGSGTKEENRLFDFTLTGHYRIAKGQR